MTNSSTDPESSKRFRAEGLGRLEALSDGIFAIAMTLLVLEIRVPEHAEVMASGGLLAALAVRWPSYFAFMLSFALIGSYWVNHHALFRLLQRTDHRFTLLTLLLLAAISFLPFPTALLGHHLLDASQTMSVMRSRSTLRLCSSRLGRGRWVGITPDGLPILRSIPAS